MDETIFSDAWFSKAADLTAQNMATSNKSLPDQLANLFATANVVIVIIPIARKNGLEKVIVKGEEFLEEIISSGTGKMTAIGVIRCRRFEEAVVMNHLFGDRTL